MVLGGVQWVLVLGYRKWNWVVFVVAVGFN